MKRYTIRDTVPGVFVPGAVIALVSLAWLLARSATKPSRIVYPCQRAAALSASVWLTAALIPVAAWARRAARRAQAAGPAAAALAMAALLPAASLLFSPAEPV